MGSQPIQPHLQSTGGRPVQQQNPYKQCPTGLLMEIWHSVLRSSTLLYL
jgi:hypothetical protein